MKSIGIIWNVAFENRFEIFQEIRKYGTIKMIYVFDLGSKYDEFVRTLYPAQVDDQWNVDMIIDRMHQSSCTNICVVEFEINSSTMYFHKRKQQYVCEELQQLKDSIRNKYSKQIPNYVFDVIFHCSDDVEEYNRDYKIIHSYFY